MTSPIELPDGWADCIVDGQLAIRDVPIETLVEGAGGTPLFIYDAERIRRRVALVRGMLPPQWQLHYSVKANPFPDLLRLLASLVDGMDVASAGELARALESGMAGNRIGFAGPGKSDDELTRAVQAGALLSIESEREMERLHATGLKLGRRPRALVRVNPAFEIHGRGMAMGGGAKPFGIDQERVPGVLARMSRLDLAFEGFHLFWGSQILSADHIAEAQRQAASSFVALSADAPRAPSLLNIGGGLGIPYGTGEKSPALDILTRGLAAAADIITRALPQTAVAMELGRYLVGEAGIYVTRILDRKESRGQVFLVTDGGLHHHLAASGNFGQALRRNFPVAIASRMNEAATERASIVGRLCTPLDRLARDALLPQAQPGDLVVIFQSGAYAASASPSAFLGHGPAAEILF